MPRPGLYYDASNSVAAGLIPNETFDQLTNIGVLADASEGGYYSVSELKYIRDKVPYGTAYQYVANLNEDEASYDNMFENPGLARRNIGFNGHVSFNPTTDISFNLSGGYQNSLNVGLSPTQDNFAQIYQDGKTSYANRQRAAHPHRQPL